MKKIQFYIYFNLNFIPFLLIPVHREQYNLIHYLTETCEQFRSSLFVIQCLFHVFYTLLRKSQPLGLWVFCSVHVLRH